MNVAQRLKKRLLRALRPKTSARPKGLVRIRHFGMNSESGNILARWEADSKEGVVVEQCPEWDRAGRALRSSNVAHICPYVPFPGRKAPRDIVGKIPGGLRVPAFAVEMVYNDARLIDGICNMPGKYELLANGDEVEVLKLARKLYGETGPVK